MAQVLSRVARIPSISRFGWLMGLYAENFVLLTRLFEPADLAPGSYLSSIGDGLDLRLELVVQHAYTTELRMTYALRDPVTGEEGRIVGMYEIVAVHPKGSEPPYDLVPFQTGRPISECAPSTLCSRWAWGT